MTIHQLAIRNADEVRAELSSLALDVVSGERLAKDADHAGAFSYSALILYSPGRQLPRAPSARV